MAKVLEPKEHIWYLEVDGEEKIFKCRVGETHCITYLGDTEHKHLKIMNPVRKDHVLQIDTITSIFGKQVPFQLENGVPYIYWDGGWKMSETNRQDRIVQTVRTTRIAAWMMVAAALIIALIGSLIGGGNTGSDHWAWYAASGFMGVGGCMTLANLKTQMNMMKEAEEELAQEKAKYMGH